MKNPYALDHLWDTEKLEAWKSMPLYKGRVVRLHAVFDRDLAMMEEQWREWCKKHPKHLWPLHIHEWAEHKKRNGNLQES